ncbi:hypothetical protein BH18CHL1_BH18CHL1_10100 [soil metagenome]
MIKEEELVGLAGQLQEACLARGVTLSVAESCTGGLVAHLITSVPGSSGYFAGGGVTYSDQLKQRLLGVPPATLESHGAVSAQVAVAMADGARVAFDTDLAVSVTGVAGPDGGSDAKPVGLTYVCVATPTGHRVQRFQWTGDRRANKMASADAALRMLLATVAAGGDGSDGSPP